MKTEAIRELKTEELHLELHQTRRHLFDLRSQAVTEKLEDPTQIAKTKQKIARILTVMRERGEENIEPKQYHLEATARHG